MTDQIISIIISVFPSALAVLTMAGTVFKVIREFAKLKKQVTDMKELSEVKSQMKQVLQENCQLKATMNELLTKIDHVERK